MRSGVMRSDPDEKDAARREAPGGIIFLKLTGPYFSSTVQYALSRNCFQLQ
jgi:hypothetical protein